MRILFPDILIQVENHPCEILLETGEEYQFELKGKKYVIIPLLLFYPHYK
jgi:hypothetical protein